MGLGIALFAFLLGLLLVSISPLRSWRLDSNAPLDDDDLKWPAAGYGSAAVSLDALFSAHAATLLLVGKACFAGVVLGVITGLVLLNRWVSGAASARGFQSFLHGLRVFESVAADRLFWFLIVTCQLGLAVSELVLLHHVFSVGLGFPSPHAFTASISIACVAYYYCLIGGYSAVFKTDALQYVFVLGMAIVMFIMMWFAEPGAISATGLQAPPQVVGLPLIPRNPIPLRLGLELLVGFALGIMPVIVAPDAWKRVLIIAREVTPGQTAKGELGEGWVSRAWAGLKLRAQTAPVKLLFVTALPIALTTPLIARSAGSTPSESVAYPLQALFEACSPTAQVFLLLGMTAAFMSTFDSGHLSATHILMRYEQFKVTRPQSELGKFRVIFGMCFAIIIVLFFALVEQAPHPYIVGAFLLGPYAVAGGIITGTSLGSRRLRGAFIHYLVVILLSVWMLLFIGNISDVKASADPLSAAPLVLAGCALYFFVAASSRLCSAKLVIDDQGDSRRWQ
jgi:Na+/proline symporter